MTKQVVVRTIELIYDIDLNLILNALRNVLALLNILLQLPLKLFPINITLTVDCPFQRTLQKKVDAQHKTILWASILRSPSATNVTSQNLGSCKHLCQSSSKREDSISIQGALPKEFTHIFDKHQKNLQSNQFCCSTPYSSQKICYLSYKNKLSG